MSLEKSLELFGILRNGLFQKYKIRRFSKIRRLVLRRIFVTQEILKMPKRLGKNPFEDNFRDQNGKFLDLFFQQNKSSTAQNDESTDAKKNINNSKILIFSPCAKAIQKKFSLY